MFTLTQVTVPEGTTQAAYDLVGNRLRQTLANGLVTDAVFDVRNRPTLLTHKSGATTLQSYATIYSPASRRTQVTEGDGSVESYAYDVKGRLDDLQEMVKELCRRSQHGPSHDLPDSLFRRR